MRAYHGTTVGGIGTLRPNASPHAKLREACVYLSTNEALASLYIWSKPYMWLTYGFAQDGIPVYTESFAGSLAYFYRGVPGYIYRCEGDFTYVDAVGIRTAVIRRSPVEVEDVRYIPDTYEEILACERQGAMRIERFETLSEAQHAGNRRMVQSAVSRLHLLNGGHPLSDFVPLMFPDLWEEARRAAVNDH